MIVTLDDDMDFDVQSDNSGIMDTEKFVTAIRRIYTVNVARNPTKCLKHFIAMRGKGGPDGKTHSDRET